MEEFKLSGRDHIKLCDLMSLLGMCENAGTAKNIVATGVVKVDGEVELRKRAKIIQNQTVEYKNHKVKVI